MILKKNPVMNTADNMAGNTVGMQTKNPAAETIAESIQNQAGITNLGAGQVYDVNIIPPELTFTTASDNGAGGATVTQNVFNNTALGALITTNGGAGGAGSIVNTYGDGTAAGVIYDQLVRNHAQKNGILIKGFTVIATVGGVQSSVPLNSLNLVLQNSDGQGNLVPVAINVAAAIRNTQFQVGTLTVRKAFQLNTLNQVRFSLPQNTTLTWTFFTETSTF